MNLQSIQKVASVAALSAVAALAIQGALLLRQVRKDEIQLAQQTSQTLTDTRRAVVIIAGTASNVEKETREWKDQSVKQVAAATLATQILDNDLLEFGATLQTVNSTVTSQAISLRVLEDQAGESIEDSSRQIDQLFTELQPAIQSLALQIPATMDNIADTSAQTVVIAKNTADTAAQIDGTATDIHNYVHRETTPARGTLHLMLSILEHIAAPASSVATAFK